MTDLRTRMLEDMQLHGFPTPGLRVQEYGSLELRQELKGRAVEQGGAIIDVYEAPRVERHQHSILRRLDLR